MDTIKNDAMNILGVVENGVAVYKGVPYAEPPVGDLRFTAPVERRPWKETLDCTKWGDTSYQIKIDLLPLKSELGDDCLNLNIFAPLGAKPGDRLPVLVWFHGGCNAMEAATTYDCTAFAKDGIIAVTVEYRLAAPGFLALDSLKSEKYGNGNWGLLDQIFALKWVNKNIDKFGGDSKNVTIAGQSAGGFNVGCMILSPMTKGLFKNVIMESMFLAHFFDAGISSDIAIGISKNIAKKLGADDSPEGVKKLKSMDTMDLVNASAFNLDVINGNPGACWPIYDGVVLPKDPIEALKKGDFNKDINVLSGFNRDEGLMFAFPPTATEENLEKSIRLVYGDTADKVIEFYKKMDAPIIAKVAHHIGYASLCIGMSKGNDLLRGKVKSLHCYQYDFTPAPNMPPTHAAEMGFTFAFDQLQQAFPDFTKVVHGYWANFIKTGDPNGPGLVKWDQYGADRKAMHLDAKCEMRGYDQQDVIDYLAPLYYKE